MGRHVGRSKGCQTCLRRRIKCDETFPECMQCVSHQKACPGPTVGAFFIDMTPRDRVPTKILVDSQTVEFKDPTASTVLDLGKHKGILTSVRLSERLPAFKVASITTLNSGAKLITRTIQLPLQSPSPATANLIQIISAYAHNGPSGAIRFSAPKGSSISWVRHLPELTSRDPILDSALAALSLAHIGKTQQDEYALQIGRISYGSTLKYLQSATIQGRRDSNVLSAINCLCVYELYDSALDNAIGYIKHIQGGQLLALDLNPNDQSPLSEINNFYIFRTMMIYNSFAARKTCCLAQYRRPNSQNPYVGFADVAEALEDTTIQIPELVEHSDNLLRLPDSTESMLLYLDIFNRWKILTYRLNEWYSRLFQNYETPFADEKMKGNGRNGNVACSSYWIAQSLMHYWAGRVLLFDALAQAVLWLMHQKDLLPLHTFTLSPLPMVASSDEQVTQDLSIEISFSSNLHLCVALIMQSKDQAACNALKGVQHVLAAELGTLSSLRSCNPLYIAIQHFQKRGMTEELEFCWRMAKDLDKGGLAAGKMLHISSSKWKSIAEGNSGNY